MSSVVIGIIGGGPRALALLQQYCLVEWNGQLPTLHVFDAAEQIGSGSVYGAGQPEYLRMNIPVANLDMFVEGFRERYPERALTYQQWCEWSGRCYEDVPARITVGEYLNYAGKVIVDVLQPVTQFHHHRDRVQTIRRYEDDWLLQIGSEDNQKTVQVNYLVMATGHEGWQTLPEQDQVSHVYPCDKNLNDKRIPSEAVVIMHGTGLTAVDACIALTQGRGGQFTEHNQSYRYEASGQEPAYIYLHSNTRRLSLPKAQLPDDLEAQALALVHSAGRQIEAIKLYRDFSQSEFHRIEDLFFKTADQVAHLLTETHCDSEEWLNDQWMTASFERSVIIGRYIARQQYCRCYDAACAAAIGFTFRYLQGYINKISNAGLFNAFDRIRYKRFTKRLEKIAFGPVVSTMNKIYALVDAGIIMIKPPEQSDQREIRTVIAYLPKPHHFSSQSLFGQLLGQGAVSRDTATQAIRVDQCGCALLANNSSDPTLGIFSRVTENWVTGNDSLLVIRDHSMRRFFENVLDFTRRPPVYAKNTYAEARR